MSTSTTELKSELLELSSESFDTFCEDIASMFEVDMESNQTGDPTEVKLVDLKKRFKKISAFNTVNTEGKLDGKFYLVFDQAGTFILSGVIVMMPEKRIMEEVKKGLIKDIESMTDAIKETGNLAVGSWDRIFRENFEGHGHFVQGNVYIGKPWNDTKQAIDLQSDEEIMFIPYEITISPFPTFNCGVIFPKSLFEEKTQKPEQKVDETKIEAETETQPETVEKEPEPQQQETQQNQQKTTIDNIENDTTTKNDTVTEDQNTNNHTDSQQEQVTLPKQGQEIIDPKQPDTTVQENIQTPQQQEPEQISKSIQEITQSTASLPGEKIPFVLNIKAQDIMNKDIIWCSCEDCVQQALTKMQKYNTRYLIIGEDNQTIQGIVSKSDLDAAISPYLRPIFSKWRRTLDDATLKIKLKWIMKRTVCFVKPQASVVAIIQKMKKSARLCLPVIQDNKVLGLITVSDIFSVILDNCPDEYKNLCDEI